MNRLFCLAVCTNNNSHLKWSPVQCLVIYVKDNVVLNSSTQQHIKWMSKGLVYEHCDCTRTKQLHFSYWVGIQIWDAIKFISKYHLTYFGVPLWSNGSEPMKYQRDVLLVVSTDILSQRKFGKVINCSSEM